MSSAHCVRYSHNLHSSHWRCRGIHIDFHGRANVSATKSSATPFEDDRGHKASGDFNTATSVSSPPSKTNGEKARGEGNGPKDSHVEVAPSTGGPEAAGSRKEFELREHEQGEADADRLQGSDGNGPVHSMFLVESTGLEGEEKNTFLGGEGDGPLPIYEGGADGGEQLEPQRITQRALYIPPQGGGAGTNDTKPVSPEEMQLAPMATLGCSQPENLVSKPAF